MGCPGLEELLRYISGETSPVDPAEIRSHVEACQPCHHHIVSLQVLDMTLEYLKREEAHAPVATGTCLDTMTLASYVDGKLFEEARTQVERHLASCPACLDELVGARQRLAIMSNAIEPTPPALLEKALSLGEHRVRTLEFLWRHLIPWIQEWHREFQATPRWLWVGAPVGVILLVLLYVTLFRPGPSIDPVVQTDPEQQVHGYGFGVTEEVFVQGKIRLSTGLQRILLAYQEQPTSATRAELIRLLSQGALQVPATQVTHIEIRPSLRARLRSAQPSEREIDVKLFKDGLLVITDAS